MFSLLILTTFYVCESCFRLLLSVMLCSQVNWSVTVKLVTLAIDANCVRLDTSEIPDQWEDRVNHATAMATWIQI